MKFEVERAGYGASPKTEEIEAKWFYLLGGHLIFYETEPTPLALREAGQPSAAFTNGAWLSVRRKPDVHVQT